MFSFAPGVTADLTLEQVLERLKRRGEVEGIVLIGSTGTGRIEPSSDYDLFIVLSSCPVPVWQVITLVDGRVAEAYFQPAEELARLVEERSQPAHTDSRCALYTRWLLSGRIEFDRSGLLADAREKLRAEHRITMWTENELYSQWFKINYNLYETRRLFLSGDPAVLTTIDLRLLFSLHDVWVNYFRFRALPWMGDKESIRYLETRDPDFLNVMREALAQTDRARKFALYEELCRLATAPIGGLWPAGSTGAQLDPAKDWDTGMVKGALDFWNGLVSEG
jgi:predicted nucleotidyltransferase